jgi:hypothetical protein
MRSPAPAPPIAALLILPAIFWGQNYVPVRPYPQIFVGFSFFIKFLDLSFCTYLLFLLCFLISSYSSLLILRLLILLLFLTVRCHSEGFFEGAKPFLIHWEKVHN